MDIYPENKIAQFRNGVDLQLDPTISYECCLHSVSFVKSWYNFTSDESYWISYVKNGRTQGTNTVTLHPGYYDKQTFLTSVQNIERDQNDIDNVHRKECVLSFDPTVYKFKLVFQHADRNANTRSKGEPDSLYDGVILSQDLARKTGFGDGSRVRALAWDNGRPSQIHYSDHAVNFDPLDYFLLQTSLIQPNHNIGNGLYPVLGLIPSTSSYGERETFTPKSRLWFEISKEELNCPEFVFMSPNGGLLPFQFGTSSVTLLIRPRDHV